MTSKSNNSELTMVLNSGITSLSTSVMKIGSLKTSPLSIRLNKMPSQRYQTNNNDVSFIEPYECPKPVVLETEVSSDQNGQTNQNDQSVQNDEILNDDHSEHSNHLNDEQIIDNLLNTKGIQISEHSSSPRVDDTSVQDTIPIPNPPLPIPSVLTRAMSKELGADSAHECLFIDLLSQEEPKKVFEALQHPRWVDFMQDELNQFARNKVWTLVPTPYDHPMNNYVKGIAKKYDINGSSVKTPMVPPNNLGPDLSGKAVNETQYRGMIRSLMYLTASRPDIQFSTCLCARYQENPKESHLIVVKRIFRYLKGTPSLGLWYRKCLGFDLKGYSDSNYARCNMDSKSTSGACQLLGRKLVCWSVKKQQYVAISSAKAEYVAASGCCANILWMKSQLTDYDIIYKKVEFKRISLTGFRSCASRSRYRSVSKQTTRAPRTTSGCSAPPVLKTQMARTRKSSSTPTQTVADNVPNAMFDGNTFVNPFATPSTSAAESSSS
ncbi:hypothetical protein Tco_0644831 [Tanacetum coccineum]